MAYKITALHPIEKRILYLLGKDDSLTIGVLSQKSDLSIDQVRRGVERLKFKKLVLITQDSIIFFELDDRGKSALLKGLPERRLVSAIQLEPAKGIASVAKSQAFEKDELGAAIRIARDQNHWLLQASGDSKRANLRTSHSISELSAEEQVIERFRNVKRVSETELNDLEKKGMDFLLRRPNYVKRIQEQTVTITLTTTGRSAAAEVAWGTP